MDIGIVGLGRMGSGVAYRLLEGGHRVVVHNRTAEKMEPLAQAGATTAQDLNQLVSLLPAPRVVWLYLPAGDVTEQHILELADLLEPGDTIIDGGNSRFTNSISRAEFLAAHGIQFLDVGTSGGIAGRTDGYC